MKRAQLVLVAAVVIAVALVPIALAYLQLGYHADVRASAPDDDPATDARAALERAVHAETRAVRGEHAWADRTAAVSAVRSGLAPRIETIEDARLERGTAVTIEYNASAAGESATEDCPGGAGREFGPCEADRGVVLQERDDQTHVLAVVFDIVVTEERGRTSVTTVVEPV